MTDTPDTELLAQFARNDSEAAFAVLVERHLGLVHSVALRHTASPQHAQDITQAVFIILARKAGALGSKTVLAGWLYHTARLTAANFQRAEARRARREQEAFMQSTLEEPAPDIVWRELSPHLDAAMARLGATDRDALVLRYFQNKTLPEVGAALGLEERAAQKRVSRALEKLRKYFGQRGQILAATAIAGAVSAHSVQAAPAALAQSVTAVAIAKGSITTASTLTLVEGTMKTMTWLKLKLALGMSITALLVGGVVTVAVSQVSAGDKLTPQEIAQQSADTYAALTSYSDSGKVETTGGGSGTETTFSIRLQRPFQYRVEWTQTGGAYTSKGIVWSEGTGNYLVMDAADKIDAAKSQKMRDMQMALASATGVSGSAASDIPGTFFNQNWGGQLAGFTSPIAKTQRLPDEQIGDTDCQVIANNLGPVALPNNGGSSGKVTTQLWIGKQDHLIHQIKATSEGATMKLQFKDDNLKTILERQGKPVTPEAIAAMRTQMEQSMKAAQGATFVFTQTHDNISVNQKFSPADFSR